MSRPYRPIAPEAVPGLIADRIGTQPGIVRVAVDGPWCAEPHTLAASLALALRSRGRPIALVRAESYWHNASLRLEYGRENIDSFLTWLDAAALRRGVLDAAVTSARYRPSLRDAATNRATREAERPLDPGTVLIVSGELLQGRGLPFDVTVHLAMSAATRARRTDPDRRWTLPAFERYDSDADPIERADVVVRLDDPRHPAVTVR